MRIGVSGSRILNYEQRRDARKILRQHLHVFGKGDVLNHGGATGIDTIAMQTAMEFGIEPVLFAPRVHDWENGYKPRNKLIVKNSDLLIAIHSRQSQTGGTIWTFQYAQRTGVEAIWIEL
jgi:hypothetical protein